MAAIFRLRAAAVLLALAATPRPVPAALTKQIASYDLKANLNHQTHTIDGSAVLTWWNDSPDTVPTLQFHLYMNAFKNEKSTFIRESGGQLRGDRFEKKEWGWIDIKSMRIVNGAELTKSIRFIHPDDGNTDDQTVIEVALPAPVKPGEKIQVAMEFVTKMPQIFARTGFHDDFYLVAQWFPKLGVWETAGFRYSTKGAWNTHQFHANSEFFANFGTYKAELTVPSNFKVGATGVQTRRKEDGKTATYTFEQEDVTDFAWCASPTIQIHERMFEAAKQVSPQDYEAAAKLTGVSPGELKLDDVRMIVLLQPEHGNQLEDHFRAAANAIKYFGLWYGKYPYSKITIVDPPFGGAGAGGMEYPTFITAGTSWPSANALLAEVVIHEFGHQYFMHQIATNEFEESWLDEGFTQYSTTKVMSKTWDRIKLPIRILGFPVAEWLRMPTLDHFSVDRAAHVAAPRSDDLVRNAWSYFDGGSYGVNSYMRTSTTLRSLENYLGEEKMGRLLRTYFQRWRFNHPTSRDFEKVANEVAGQDLGWFFNQFVFGNRELDYAVTQASSNEIGTAAGVFDRDGKKNTVSVEEARKSGEGKKERKKLYRTTVKVQRLADAVVPVEIRVKFKDGHIENRTWDGQYRWVKYVFERSSEIESAQIDPGNKWLLDINLANNSKTAEPSYTPIAKWSSHVLFWVENLMLLASGIL